MRVLVRVRLEVDGVVIWLIGLVGGVLWSVHPWYG